ncbi:DUF2156 domain-containing protein [Desulfoluna spongiiphila]|uniref:Uncharacterized conserved protein n=1 Tax=Desulfoluna spongiiphila TaxID=419481 RepID=A0A1G5BNE2_9BACT|nr:DUF2156 domain-containing protein [Desulfoluna spongiiphila]SCX91709.1 Uncharacterized conserved protein [Desulfoluna spongiiphila]VVS93831.1 acyl-coa n-acyltransferase [Desulfoluna spongiiphila]
MENYRKYGSFTMAYSIKADPHFSHFSHEKGSIAYQDRLGVRIFVGDPFCRTCDAPAVINAFIKESRLLRRPLVGMQCSLDTARLFSDQGFDATHMGVETLILNDWSIKGKNVGRRIRKAHKKGLTVTEARWDSDASLPEQATAISEAWRQTRKTKTPLNLLLREPTFRDEPDERTFFAWLDGTLVGYVTFEAMYDHHQTIGWYANINRRDDSRNIAIFDAIVDVALECFKAEPGFKVLSLGLAPMAGRHNDHGFSNRLVERVSDLSYKYGNDGYNYKGIFQSKKGYWPKSFEQNPNQVEVRDTYCITRGSVPLDPVAKAFMGVGILPEGLAHTAWFATRMTVAGMWREFRRTSRSNLVTFWKGLTASL